ncbi:hypothetical protein ACJJTC_019850 [Scirpophaga incertulas]
MLKIIFILSAVSVSALSAEMSASYALLEKHTAFNPDLKTKSVNTLNKTTDSLDPKEHPVYSPHDSLPKIKPIKATEPIVKYERMLSDQSIETKTEVNRIENGDFVPTHNLEVSYPDVAYAPGYNHNEYADSKNYEMNEESPSPYYEEPTEITPFSLLWSQIPDSRMIGSLLGRTMSWIFRSIFTLLLGTLLTLGVCTYTNICTITVNGVSPIHDEMRSIVTPAGLKKIGHAADFVKRAIDKYQEIQTLDEIDAFKRKRRAITL